MGQIYSFHRTERGALHFQRGVPCQDYSASLAGENGEWFIAVTADGHGDASCFRSDRGSRFAVEAACAVLKNWAEDRLKQSKSQREQFFSGMFNNQTFRENFMRGQLINSIMNLWQKQVREDFTRDPPQTGELERSGYLKPGEQADAAPAFEDRHFHIYGTTLMAALWMESGLFFIHQGDGRIEVFYRDGKINQPVPWDEKCSGNRTTSLCEGDARERFRYYVLNLEEEPVMGCYLGCDGVEDAYRDSEDNLGGSHEQMGGVHTFYKHISCEAVERGEAGLEAYLETFLHDFSARGFCSKNGSGDDVSVSGIVDPEALAGFVPRYQKDIRLYDLEEQLFWCQNELDGKRRKRDVLFDNQLNTEDEWNRKREEELTLRSKLVSDKRMLPSLEQDFEKAEGEKEAFIADKKLITQFAAGNAGQDDLVAALKRRCPQFFQYISSELEKAREDARKMFHAAKTGLENHKTLIQQEEERLIALGQEVQEAMDADGRAKKEYEEYDEVFQKIVEKKKCLKEQIEKLKTP
ncbi:MAG: protein phosphatase 2C domain-containing protein [Oscillibacter sp.]|nr:protein phosphatase 2C domain-containing protein [Oscillibacter sp.]